MCSCISQRRCLEAVWCTNMEWGCRDRAVVKRSRRNLNKHERFPARSPGREPYLCCILSCSDQNVQYSSSCYNTSCAQMSRTITVLPRSIVPPCHFPSCPSLGPYRSLVIHFPCGLELLYEVVNRLVLYPGFSFCSPGLQGKSLIEVSRGDVELTRSGPDEPSPPFPKAGESTRDPVPLLPFPLPFSPLADALPSMNVEAIFSESSSWAVIECLSRKCRNEGRCRYKSMSEVSTPRSRGCDEEQHGKRMREAETTCLIKRRLGLLNIRPAGLHTFRMGVRLGRSIAQCYQFVSQVQVALCVLISILSGSTLLETDALALSSFSLPSLSTSAANCCTSGRVNKNASVNGGEESRSFRKEGGYWARDGNCCNNGVDMAV